jgi:hypothetical protein
MSENYKLILELANEDAVVLEEKGRTYGDSWCKRGGVGAFMMLARKWDRIENICEAMNYNVFDACQENTGDILDDIADLRRYLLLVEAHVKGTPFRAFQDQTHTQPHSSGGGLNDCQGNPLAVEIALYDQTGNDNHLRTK